MKLTLNIKDFENQKIEYSSIFQFKKTIRIQDTVELPLEKKLSYAADPHPSIKIWINGEETEVKLKPDCPKPFFIPNVFSFQIKDDTGITQEIIAMVPQSRGGYGLNDRLLNWAFYIPYFIYDKKIIYNEKEIIYSFLYTSIAFLAIGLAFVSTFSDVSHPFYTLITLWLIYGILLIVLKVIYNGKDFLYNTIPILAIGFAFISFLSSASHPFYAVTAFWLICGISQIVFNVVYTNFYHKNKLNIRINPYEYRKSKSAKK